MMIMMMISIYLFAAWKNHTSKWIPFPFLGMSAKKRVCKTTTFQDKSRHCELKVCLHGTTSPQTKLRTPSLSPWCPCLNNGESSHQLDLNMSFCWCPQHKNGDHHLGCIKPIVDGGIHYHLTGARDFFQQRKFRWRCLWTIRCLFFIKRAWLKKALKKCTSNPAIMIPFTPNTLLDYWSQVSMLGWLHTPFLRGKKSITATCKITR